ncbi:class I SAM-dependent methyltransferase [Candidatus Bathyarchaeota archaeon]|nr:MAG: class I SAM-dependent methyltransferase [Candidatus Bathyarchaeota archaeon]
MDDVHVRSVTSYYNKNVVGEWKRLVSNPYCRLELETTLHFLDKYLPGKGLVLDAGGGPGRYAIELARRKHKVILLDISSASLEFARRQTNRAGFEGEIETTKGSVEDLSQFATNRFDSVLCLGPLSHIMTKRERSRAIRELVRVTKRRGILCVSVIGRLGAIVSHLEHLNEHIAYPFFKKFRDVGDYFGQYRFTATHTFLPEELRMTFKNQKDLRVLETVGLEGLSSGQEEKVNELAKNRKLWKAWLDTHYKTCTNPSVVGMSEHMMIICRKL